MAELLLPDDAFLWPDWPAPVCVRAVTTTRVGGASRGAWRGFNLATHCDDAPAAVVANRAALGRSLQLPVEPAWLEQVHGCDVLEVPICGTPEAPPPTADAAWTRNPEAVCAILTADCLPVVFCDRAGTCVAVAHAGWRSLVAGILEATVATMAVPPAQMLAWLGPCIGPAAFEVGPEVRAAFCNRDPGAREAFRPSGRGGHWLADLPRLARRRLAAVGVSTVYGGDWCTVNDPQRFFSYRRDGVTGRMATLAWIQAQNG